MRINGEMTGYELIIFEVEEYIGLFIFYFCVCLKFFITLF